MAKGGFKNIADILILLGGIVGIIQGILAIFNMNVGFLHLFGGWGGVVVGVILIVLSLIVLATSGKVNIKQLKAANNWIVYLILGILLALFDGELAGILVIIGAILLLL